MIRYTEMIAVIMKEYSFFIWPLPISQLLMPAALTTRFPLFMPMAYEEFVLNVWNFAKDRLFFATVVDKEKMFYVIGSRLKYRSRDTGIEIRNLRQWRLSLKKTKRKKVCLHSNSLAMGDHNLTSPFHPCDWVGLQTLISWVTFFILFTASY
jgi:hypothetical protein